MLVSISLVFCICLNCCLFERSIEKDGFHYKDSAGDNASLCRTTTDAACGLCQYFTLLNNSQQNHLHFSKNEITNSSIKLEWVLDENLKKHFNQSNKTVELVDINSNETEWIEWTNVEWQSQWVFVVKNLIPYTNYKFRLVLDNDLCSFIATEKSSPIVTNAYGVPKEAPTIQLLEATSSWIHINISPPRHTYAELLNYYSEIYLKNKSLNNQNYTLNKTLFISIPPKNSLHGIHDDDVSYNINSLDPEMDYIIYVYSVNNNGKGPKAEIEVKAETRKHSKNSGYLVIALRNEIQIRDIKKRKNFLIYSLHNTSSITDISPDFLHSSIYVVLSNGEIRKVKVGGSFEKVVKYTRMKEKGDKIIINCVHDEIFKLHQKQLLRCNLDLSKCAFEANLTPQINNLHLNHVNRILIWSNQTHLNLLNMQLKITTAIPFKNIRSITSNPCDDTLYLSTDQSIYSFKISNPEKMAKERDKTKIVNNLIKFNDLFYWVEGELVYSEDFDSNGEHFIDTFAFASPIVSMAYWGSPITQDCTKSPSEVNVQSNGTSVQISWKSPWINDGCKSNEWQYEIEVYSFSKNVTSMIKPREKKYLMLKTQQTNNSYTFNLSEKLKHNSKQSVLNFDNISSTSLNSKKITQFPKLDSTWFRIRAYVDEFYTPWTQLMRIKLFKEIPRFYYNKNGKIYEETMNKNKQLLKGNITDFQIFLNSSLVMSRDKIYVSGVCNGFYAVKGTIKNNGIVFDFSTDTLYWVDESALKIKRKRLIGEISTETVVETNYKIKGIILKENSGLLYWFGDYFVQSSKLNGENISKIVDLEDRKKRFVKKKNRINEQNEEKILGIHYIGNVLYYFSLKNGLTCISKKDSSKKYSTPKIFCWQYNEKIISNIVYFDECLFWMAMNTNNKTILHYWLLNSNKIYHFSSFFNFQQVFLKNGFMTLNLRKQTKIDKRYCDVHQAPPIEYFDVTSESSTRVSMHWNTSKRVDDMYFEVLTKNRDGSVHEVNQTSKMSLTLNQHFLNVGVRACTVWMCGNTTWMDLTKKETSQSIKSQQSGTPLVISCTVLIIIIAIILVYMIKTTHNWLKKKKPYFPPNHLVALSRLPTPNIDNSMYLYSDSLDFNHSDFSNLPRISKDQLGVNNFLGSGAFGKVYEGTLTVDGHQFKVAIKTLHKMATEMERKEFTREACLMHNFRHHKVLKLLGVVVNVEQLLLVIELMPMGDLLTFLRKNKMIPTLSVGDLLLISHDIAEGCQYLQEKRFVHRDLAARNCLVGHEEGRLVVKISDFGLARDIYNKNCYRKIGEGLLPIRWMAPESLSDGVFTTYSDIWAYGVLVWEVFSQGAQPYLGKTNVEVLHFVKNGGMLEKPKLCSSKLYSLMQSCWIHNPLQRPLFSKICESLDDFINIDECTFSFSEQSILLHQQHTYINS